MFYISSVLYKNIHGHFFVYNTLPDYAVYNQNGLLVDQQVNECRDHIRILQLAMNMFISTTIVEYKDVTTVHYCSL